MLLVGCLIALPALSSYAATTIKAGTCGTADVLTAINSASDGDTVLVPACDPTTWTSGIRMCKSLTLQGAGAGNTTIISNTSVDPVFGVTNPCNGKTIRVTGFTFIDQLIVSGGMINFFHCFGCVARVDHNTFIGNATTNGRAIGFIGSVTGVIDHNTVQDMGMKVSYTISGEPSSNTGDNSWTQAPSFGTNNAIYVEDNTISWVNHTDQWDCDNGGRVVYRYNTFTKAVGLSGLLGGTGPFNHGYDSVPRSCFEVDVYNNTILGGGTRAIQFRGGSGLIYNNIISGKWDNAAFELDSYRSEAGSVGGAGNRYGNICDGTQPVDGNTAGTNGWPCRDQVGRGTDNGNPGAQGSYPIYSWNNCMTALGCTPGGVDAVVPIPKQAYGGTPNYVSIHIVANRDYYDMVPSFNGTVGVGQGTLNARPSTCTAGVAYWGTDTNVLYKCSATNTWITYYTPFQYPHPLVGAPVIEPPSKLSVVVS
ncbi:MAG: hypothetical protein ACRD3Q_10910 [Terriglobales bacterium]